MSTSPIHPEELLDKALEHILSGGKSIRIRTETEALARALRFRLYTYRTRDRKLQGGRSAFDQLAISVQLDTDGPAIIISPAMTGELELL